MNELMDNKMSETDTNELDELITEVSAVSRIRAEMAEARAQRIKLAKARLASIYEH
jgi:hypothetical protein